MSKIVRTFPNFLSKNDWDTVFYDYIRQPRWQFGHVSNGSVPDAPLYWSQDLTNEKFFSEYMVGMIRDAVGENLQVKYIYAGANTFGTSGDMHTDHIDDDRYTFLYYASPDKWQSMWGGKTSFYPKPRGLDNENNEYYEFIPNRGLFFPSNVLHVGEPTTKFFTGLRVCIAFKMVLI